MGFYYTVNRQTTSNSSAATETDHLSIKPGSSRMIQLVQMRVSARNATVGGATLRLKRYNSTASSGGGAQAIKAKDDAAQASTAAAICDSSSITAGTGGPDVLDSIGFSQTGAQGFWGAAEPNDAYVLDAGATKSFDFFSICNGTSVPLDITTEHIE
jgi:hypothetical protein